MIMNDYNNISAIILSGGKSSRYGKDKCDLIYNGDTFLNNQINKFVDIGINDIIACGYRGINCNANIIEDNVSKGPMSGIYFGLRAIKNDRAVVISVDVPLVKIDTILKLIEYSYETDNDIVAIKHNDNIEPLVAIYNKKLIDIIKEHLKGDNYSLMRLIDNCNTGLLEINDNEQFLNVNYKDDYEKLINEYQNKN